jgi:hypothetical protein
MPIQYIHTVYSGFHFDPQLASRDDFRLAMTAIPLKKGVPNFVPTNPHKPFSEIQNIGIERSYGHFGPINKCLEALILDTGFRCLLALNGRDFGINVHLAVNPTPHHRLKGPKPEGSTI